MQQIKILRSDMEISVLGLGTMYFGSGLSPKESYKLLDCYHQNGGRFFDSANKYASWVPGNKGGESEEVIGTWMMKQRKSRTEIVLCSKVGFAYGQIPRSLNREIIISECEKSLKKLKTDYIDLYFAHCDDFAVSQQEYMEAFFQLKKTGKIRYAGASNFQSWRLATAQQIASQQGWEGFVCVQQRHSLLEPSLRADTGTQTVLTPEMISFCHYSKLSIMAYSPLMGGLYDKFDEDVPLHYQNPNSMHRLTTIRELALKHKTSANAMVLAWMMQDNPAVIPLITGSKVSQIEDSLSALTINLSQTETDQINRDILVSPQY